MSPASNALQDIAATIKKCSLCALHKARTNTVPGTGINPATFMFVGEGPGRYEDEQGLPFVGRSGMLLDELLASVQIEREYVFITNIVKCRPPENRDPLPEELKACSPYLEKQIELIAPYVIVTLGRMALEWFGKEHKVGEVRGKMLLWEDRVLVPMYHPAAGLRNPSFKAAMQEDILVLPEALKYAINRKHNPNIVEAQSATSVGSDNQPPQLHL